MKLDALKHQGIKDDSTSRQVGEKSYSIDTLSENSNDSARNIHRYIRLTELLPTLLQMVDNKKLAFNPAVELSYLNQQEQEWLLSSMGQTENPPSLSQSSRLKKFSQDGKLDENVIAAILTEEHPAPIQITLKNNHIQQYFPANYTQAQVEEVIFTLLESWRSRNKTE